MFSKKHKEYEKESLASPGELEELAKLIRPVVRKSAREDPIGSLYWVEPLPLDLESFFHKAKTLGPADDIEAMATMRTSHPSPDGFFKPTIAQILTQIPRALRPAIVAFEVTTTLTGKTVQRNDRPAERYFLAKTILYRRKESEGNEPRLS